MRFARSLRSIRLAAALAIVAGGCAGGDPRPPEVGEAPSSVPPSLVSRRVMVLPVQDVVGVSGRVDDELAFALAGRGDEVLWIPVDRVRAAVGRAPAMEIPLDALPVEQFLQIEVRRIGDPLYGILRRAAALVDAEVALIPVQLRARPDEAERPGAVEVRVALIQVLTGRVLWYGVEQGRAGDGTDPAALASAMETMARRLVPGM